ncbi:MAG TPA: tail fiber domain-containing protein [Povalibacter sp.]
MANMYINAMTDAWSSSGTTYNAIKMDVSIAASASDSRLFKLLANSSDKFSVDKDGNVATAGALTATGALLPAVSDGAALGSTTYQWSDVYLASTGTINFASSNVVLTHSTGNLTVSTGDLRVTTAGTNTASVVTVGGTQTLTGKTLTSPTITGATLTTGAFNGTVGATTPSSGTFSTLVATTADINGGTIDDTPIGATTPDTGAFTTLTASGTVTAATSFISSTTDVVVAPTSAAGNIYLRPGGSGSGTGSLFLTTTGAQFNQGVAFCGLPGFGAQIYGGTDKVYAFTATAFLYLDASANMGFSLAATTRFFVNGTNGNFTATQTGAAKPGGGSWADSSDTRIKTVQGDYETGLEAILGLHPVRYTFKGNDTIDVPRQPQNPGETEEDVINKGPPTVPYPTSPHRVPAENNEVFIGLIAQEVETVMPSMVTQRAAYIDGLPVDDLRDLNTSELIFTLINAVKELAGRIEALEGN